MASLENLNFEVILKDDTFKNQIAQVQKLADNFNITMSQALSLTGVKGGVKNVQELAKALKAAAVAQGELNAAVKASPAEKITIRHRDAVSATNQQMMNSARLLRTLGTLTGGAFSVYGIRRFLSSLIEITGQFEVQKMALRTMLQDIDAADKIFQDLYRFSSDSTYRFSELAKYSKQLAAFNIGKDSLLETTKMLGDVASGVGVSMDRLILAYGHVKSSGFLRGIQLRSFSQNGVPILDELAKMFTEIEGKAVSLGDVFDKMTRREIPFEMVEEAFKRMTSEGGKFYQMQEVLSKTLAGQMNILKGRWENLMYAVGQSQEGMLKGAVSGISNLVANYDEVGRLLKQIIVTFGIYKATLIGVELATNTFAVANHRVLQSLTNVGKWMMANPYALLAAGIAAVAFATIRYVNALSDQEKIQRSAQKTISDFNNSLSSEIGELDALYAKLRLAARGTDEYASAKKAIETRFSPYIEQLRQEGVAINDLSSIYDNLAAKIRDANKQRFLESGMSDLGKTWGDVQTGINKKIDAVIGDLESDINRKLTAAEKLALKQSITGGVAEGKESDVASIIAGIFDGYDDSRSVQRAIAKRQGPGSQDIKKRIQDLTTDYSKGMQQYVDSVTELHNAFDSLNKSLHTNNEEEDEHVYKISSIVQGIKRIDSEIASLRNKARGGSITQGEKDRLDALVKEREEAAKEYKDIMGVDYDKGVLASAKAVESANKEELRSLQKRASVIQKYKDAYDTLRPFIGEENIASVLGDIFGAKFDDTDFDDELDRIIVKLSELGEEGNAAAESLRASLGKDTASELKKSIEAHEKASEMIADYLKKDFGIEGEGVAAQISKLLVDLSNKNLKADKDLEKYVDTLDKAEVIEKMRYLAEKSDFFNQFGYDEKRRDAAAEVYWQNYRKQQIDAYKERLKLEKDTNRKLSNEKIVGLADDLFKRLTQAEGIDLTDWNDKTISQLRLIKEELASLQVPDEILNMLDDETRKKFTEFFDLIRGGEIKKSDKVIDEKMVQTAKRLASAFSEVGASMTSIGDAVGNEVLSGMGGILSLAQEITGVISENESLMKSLVGNTDKLGDGMDRTKGALSDMAKSADWITMIIKLVVIYFRELVNVIDDNKEKARALSDAIIEARAALYEANLQEGVESIFGTNYIRGLQNAARNIRDITSAIGEYKDEISSRRFTASRMSWFEWLISGNNGERGPMERTATLESLAAGIGRDLYDEYNNLNAETLGAILEAYTDLTDEERAWINTAINDSKAYRDALDSVNEMMKSVFGEIASSAADTIVDSWVEAGSAALDYADILDDVARSYAKMLIESSILDSVFDTNEIERVKQMFLGGDYEGAMAAIAGDMEQIAGMEPVFQQILEAFDPYFNKESSGGTLANGIKGITEDTANLLASYLNAIRADVSFLRAMAQQGWANVENITVSLAVLPSLADYMARIEAHNANTAENTRQILSELRGVIVNEGSGRGFRSYPA